MTCHRCIRRPRVRPLGTVWYCERCFADELFRVNGAVGSGLSIASAPEWPDVLGYALLECSRCDSTWVGPPAEVCPWCLSKYMRVLKRFAKASRRELRRAA